MRRWQLYVALGVAVPALIVFTLIGYYYVSFSRMIDARLHGEVQRTDPRIFARPFVVRRGQRLTLAQMIDRLNELGYAHRDRAEQPGEFAIGRDALVVVPRAGDRQGQAVRFAFAARAGAAAGGLTAIELPGRKQILDSVALDAPLVTALVPEGREKRRDVPLSAIPQRMAQAVIAIEDRRFYDHPGIDPIGTTRAVLTNIFGSKRYLSGGSTITQQLVRNTFLSAYWGIERAQEKTPKRKFTEWLMSIALERRLSKDQILELYLNDVWLGQRGSFAVHGVPEAARLFFGKDVSNVSLTEAATIAGVIQAPPRYSPFNNPDKSKERRNVVLHAMAESGFITEDAAERASHEPLQVVRRALDAEAPYFVDYVTQELQERSKAVGAIDVYTTLDLRAATARAGRRRNGARARGRDPRAPETAEGTGGADCDRSAHGRDPGDGRRPLVQPVPVQPGGERAASAGIGLQAVRVSRRVRARPGRRTHRHHTGHGRAR